MKTIGNKYDVMMVPGHKPIKAWLGDLPLADNAQRQLESVAKMPFIHKWVAVMPDVHVGKGATVGSVIPTHKAVIPAAVGVDLGCGMSAVRTSLTASDLPDSLQHVRGAIERVVPHGRTDNGGRNDRGAFGELPKAHGLAWSTLKDRFDKIVDKHPRLGRGTTERHLGTLGTGNHFIEICLDETDQVWVMLHSGSRGVGNRIGSYFISMAKEDMRTWHINLPHADLAYLPEGTKHFGDYVEAVSWAQDFAKVNRQLMMSETLKALRDKLPPFTTTDQVVDCHHNYVAKESHFGANVWVTRKGAVRARVGDVGIIPGSMGAKSFIVRGKGNPDSFCSCSHGAGRAMTRTEARRRFTVEDHAKATDGVECRKDVDVIDETPAAYKPIEQVMAAQSDLVDIAHTLKQIVCVKG